MFYIAHMTLESKVKVRYTSNIVLWNKKSGLTFIDGGFSYLSQ